MKCEGILCTRNTEITRLTVSVKELGISYLINISEHVFVSSLVNLVLRQPAVYKKLYQLPESLMCQKNSDKDQVSLRMIYSSLTYFKGLNFLLSNC